MSSENTGKLLVDSLLIHISENTVKLFEGSLLRQLVGILSNCLRVVC